MEADSSDEEDDEPENLQYKIVVLGNGTVGKTSLVMRLCEDHFARSYKQTIGVDFFVKRIELPGKVNIALQVWDIGGQSIFSKMIGTYIYEANAVRSILIFLCISLGCFCIRYYKSAIFLRFRRLV